MKTSMHPIRFSISRLPAVVTLFWALGMSMCTSIHLLADEKKVGSPTEAKAEEKTDADLVQLNEWMTGSFSSLRQSEADPAYFHVVLHMAPLFPEKKGEHWLYVEQAMASAPERPYRQRVYQLTRDANGTLLSRVYNLPGNPLDYAGAWKKPEALKDLKETDLKEKVGCAILLKRASKDTFEGSTKDKDCASELNGATYATSKVSITSELLESWDQGFGADDAQVWGAKAGPYKFVKEKKPAGVPTVPTK